MVKSKGLLDDFLDLRVPNQKIIQSTSKSREEWVRLELQVIKIIYEKNTALLFNLNSSTCSFLFSHVFYVRITPLESYFLIYPYFNFDMAKNQQMPTGFSF